MACYSNWIQWYVQLTIVIILQWYVQLTIVIILSWYAILLKNGLISLSLTIKGENVRTVVICKA